uniref:Uncharacterized protein n=1 Tax=Dulem virus 35 TaxID=3145753 RepID=A0AAU8AYQ8_9CAUD
MASVCIKNKPHQCLTADRARNQLTILISCRNILP